MKKKTAAQWLMTLPKELRESASKAMWSRFDLSIKFDSLSEVIICSINWFSTEEGHEFWESFYDCLLWTEIKE